jgi:hypothetical protein
VQREDEEEEQVRVAARAQSVVLGEAKDLLNRMVERMKRMKKRGSRRREKLGRNKSPKPRIGRILNYSQFLPTK